MKQGDFPLYTIKKLDEIWARWNKKKDELRFANKLQNQSAKPSTQVKPKENLPKPQLSQHKPQLVQQKPKEAAVVTTDMLEQLKMKFVVTHWSGNFRSHQNIVFRSLYAKE